MGTKLLHFYATKEDLLPVVRWIEDQRTLKYVLAGLLFTNKLQVFHSATELPTLGTATHESAICGSSYLVAERDENIVSHDRPQNAGGVRYEVSQFGNPKTITFQHGGLYEASALLYGRIGTVSDDPVSVALFRLFVKAIRKHFSKFDIYYVGSAAEALWNSGTRLTQAVQSPREFDLTR